MNCRIAEGSTLREIIDNRAASCRDTDMFAWWNANHSAQLSVTSEEFRKQVETLGAFFRSEGFNGKHIAIIGENSYQWILTFFAISCSGNVAVFLDKTLSVQTLGEMITFNDCKAVCCSKMYSDIGVSLKDTCGIKLFSLDEMAVKAADDSVQDRYIEEYRLNPPRPDDVAAIAFTSGTSGKQKGVVLTHKNIAADAFATSVYINGHGHGLPVLPLHHMFAVISLFIVIIWKGTAYISSGVRYLGMEIAEVKPNIMNAVPALLPLLYQAFVKTEHAEDATVVCGGAAGANVWAERFESIGINLSAGYGLTECSPIVAVTTDMKGGTDTSMVVLDCCRVRIENPDEDGIGEILISGDNVMKCYYKQDEETEKVLHEGWLHTGDSGKIDRLGRLTVTGRMKNILVLSNGENVAPEPIEKRVLEIPGVEECVADTEGGVLIIRVYAPEADRDEVCRGINDVNRELISSHRIMKTVFVEEAFEKNSNGKIIRKTRA